MATVGSLELVDNVKRGNRGADRKDAQHYSICCGVAGAAVAVATR
jgi:hypothetical protein